MSKIAKYLRRRSDIAVDGLVGFGAYGTVRLTSYIVTALLQKRFPQLAKYARVAHVAAMAAAMSYGAGRWNATRKYRSALNIGLAIAIAQTLLETVAPVLGRLLADPAAAVSYRRNDQSTNAKVEMLMSQRPDLELVPLVGDDDDMPGDIEEPLLGAGHVEPQSDQPDFEAFMKNYANEDAILDQMT
jgi:hypothetical protein